MILRRPYAFLIKYFKVIHLLLFTLLAYIAYKANGILSFFKEYISSNGNMEVIASEYVSFLIVVSTIMIIAISVVIYFLMRYKKKPRLFYILLMVITVISSILFGYLYSNIRTLETMIMSAREIRLLRDTSRVNFWILFLSSIPTLIRGLGFDIKKFNFTRDLHDLKLEEKDREEVEVNVELNSDTVKRTGRRLTRELKYYYAENKFFINIILSVVGIILILMFPFNMFVVNRDLNEKEVLGTNYFNIKVNDSYLSERKRVSKDNSYVILNISLKGKTSKYKLDLDEFVLEGKNNKYVPSLKYYYYFSDLGIGYKNYVLDTKDYKEYLLIYNIKNEDRKSKFTLNYLGSKRKVRLNPEVLD